MSTTFSSITTKLISKISSSIFITSIIFLIIPFVILGHYVISARDNIYNEITNSLIRTNNLREIETQFFKIEAILFELKASSSSEILQKNEISNNKNQILANLRQIAILQKQYAKIGHLDNKIISNNAQVLTQLMNDFIIFTLKIMQQKEGGENIQSIQENVTKLIDTTKQLKSTINNIIILENQSIKDKKQELKLIIHRMFFFVSILIILLLTSYFLVSVILAQSLARPMIRLNKYASLINEEKYDAPSPRLEQNEFGIFQENIINMVHKIIGQKNRLETVMLELNEREAYLALILNSVGDGVVLINALGIILLVNPACESIFSCSKQKLIGENIFKRISFNEENKTDLFISIKTIEELSKANQIIEISGLTVPDKKEIPLEFRAAELLVKEETQYILTFRDVSLRKKAEAKFRHMATHDGLTGLINRVTFLAFLEKEIAMAKRDKKMFAVIFLDLDRFKKINDGFGHVQGDQLLIQVTERILGIIRESDVFCRLGGDEFTLMVKNIISHQDVETLIKKIIKSLTLPFKIAHREMYSTASLGIALFPEDGDNPEKLIKNADAAMYQAKTLGRNTYAFYEPGLNAALEDSAQITIENDIHGAIDKNELFIVYQPQINYLTQKISGLEALLRWRHPTLGVIFPDNFIPLAETIGLINDFGSWVLMNACLQYQKWLKEGRFDNSIKIAVNVSLFQLTSDKFLSILTEVLKNTGISPENLELEITETMLMSKGEVNIPKRLQAIRDLGVRIAIDDFGTGYSSLSYLKSLPVSTLKIDKSFIQEVGFDKTAVAIVDSILSLAANLGISVIAEGVEQPVQEQHLLDKNCLEAQGFLYSKPLEKAEVEKLFDVTQSWLSKNAQKPTDV